MKHIITTVKAKVFCQMPAVCITSPFKINVA